MAGCIAGDDSDLDAEDLSEDSVAETEQALGPQPPPPPPPPATCQEIRTRDPNAGDGHYLLHVDHDVAKGWTAYCYNMASLLNSLRKSTGSRVFAISSPSMVDERASGPAPDSPEIPPAKPGRSPYRRLVLLGLFLLTLPFEWGELSSCQGGPRTFTGIDVLTEHPQNGISIAVLFLMPVLLGLVQHRVRNAVARLLMEFVSMLFGSLGTLFCFVNAVFSGGFTSSGRFYPAPWIATLAPLLTVIDACQGAVGRIRDIVQERKQRQQVATNDEPAKLSAEP